MLINDALNNRALNTYGSAINESILYRKLTSLIEQYNRLAISKGLPTKKVPVYTSHINDVLITRSINAILNDIDELRYIKNKNDDSDGPLLRYGVYDGEFPDTNSSFVIDSWKYTVIEPAEGNKYLNVSVNDTSITEMPEDLPFNVITDTQGDVLKVTDMGSMFHDCTTLTSIDLSNFNTSNVTNMGSMFYICPALTSIDLSNFNTLNVTNMDNMFRGCGKLKSIDLSNFNTSSVTNMSQMFRGCSTLTIIDLSNLNTSEVTNMSYLFADCSTLKSITFGDKFNTSNVNNMDNIFRACNSLTEIKLYKASAKLLTKFPGGAIWYANDTALSGTNWINSWGDGPVTFTRTIQPSS